ncbi:hypothetical protein HYW46_03585 [Candidatus Daviesbacteria bacterium]|nr:hypothetical protein [Candidatus Daviesbacteria bacterium]
MTNETFNPDKFRAISVDVVFTQPLKGLRPFSARIQDRFRAIEASNLSTEGEPNLLFRISQMATKGDSLRDIASQYGLTHKLVGKLMKISNIPYFSRREAIQRL